jgi:RNase H-fold protein (predicted Holliday junction resolvase)
MKEIYEVANTEGFSISRYGITLDWTMGYPPDQRKEGQKGTGIVLYEPVDFARISNATPAATHFGDFMLGLPGSLHNTKSAIAAGVTSIGNLGQYFTFRLPYWDDDVATTEATVTALGLIAAQKEEILVHSNLDDGFAGMFRDMSSALGMVMIEKYIVEDLIGANISFCFGHHYSESLRRAAFHAADFCW